MIADIPTLQRMTCSICGTTGTWFFTSFRSSGPEVSARPEDVAAVFYKANMKAKITTLVPALAEKDKDCVIACPKCYRLGETALENGYGKRAFNDADIEQAISLIKEPIAYYDEIVKNIDYELRSNMLGGIVDVTRTPPKGVHLNITYKITTPLPIKFNGNEHNHVFKVHLGIPDDNYLRGNSLLLSSQSLMVSSDGAVSTGLDINSTVFHQSYKNQIMWHIHKLYQCIFSGICESADMRASQVDLGVLIEGTA